MKRLPKGYGSVYKLSGDRRKPYTARVQDGYSPATGLPLYKYLGYYETRAEALQALSDYHANPYNLDMKNYTLADMWEIFQGRKFEKISQSGKNIYNAAYKHLNPLHHKPMREIKPFEMQRILDGINRKWQTKSHVLTLLKQLFEIALELDIIKKNYAQFLQIGSKEDSTLHKAFTQEEIRRLFSVVFTEPYADTVLIMIYTGLRPSELLGIQTENVNLSERYLIGGMKTKAGKNRIIPLNDKVFPFVRKRLEAGTAFLIEKDGEPLNYDRYKKIFRDLMQRLEMEHLPHDCRHTFASLADTAGMNKTAVKRIMGHSSNDITEKVYTHKDAAELLANVNMI